MFVAVGGSRHFCDREVVFSVLDQYFMALENEKPVILSGHSAGVDRLAEEYADLRGYEVQLFLPDWSKYGRAAGPKRNLEMVALADGVIAFWDHTSRGTASLIACARKLGRSLLIVDIEPQ